MLAPPFPKARWAIAPSEVASGASEGAEVLDAAPAPPNLREKVEALERAMLTSPQTDCPVRHYFAPGVFAREITIPAGTILTGAVHKTENLAVLSAGVLSFLTDEGPKIISAPYVVTVKAGAKNCALALETAVFTNFFANPTNETDIDKLIEMLSESTAAELLGGAKNLQLAANKAAQLAATEVAQIEGD